MKTNILITVMLMASKCLAAGGEVGNERVTSSGQPRSTVVRPCDSHQRFDDFHKSMLTRPGYSDYFKFLREIYPPLQMKLANNGYNVVICETREDINKMFAGLDTSDSRIALFVVGGEGASDLMIINRPLYNSNRISDAQRAATISRELLFNLFRKSSNCESARIEWMQHRLVHETYTAYKKGGDAEPVMDLLKKFQLLNPSADLRSACSVNLNDCKVTLQRLEKFDGRNKNVQLLYDLFKTKGLVTYYDTFTYLIEYAAQTPDISKYYLSSYRRAAIDSVLASPARVSTTGADFKTWSSGLAQYDEFDGSNRIYFFSQAIGSALYLEETGEAVRSEDLMAAIKTEIPKYSMPYLDSRVNNFWLNQYATAQTVLFLKRHGFRLWVDVDNTQVNLLNRYKLQTSKFETFFVFVTEVPELVQPQPILDMVQSNYTVDLEKKVIFLIERNLLAKLDSSERRKLKKLLKKNKDVKRLAGRV